MNDEITLLPSVVLTHPSLTIYRVHYTSHLLKGLYVNGAIGQDLMMDLDVRHPVPIDDPDLGFWDLSDHNDYIFGFKSLEQLKFWIYKQDWINELIEEGCVISRLVASHTDYLSHGRTQAIIHQDQIAQQSHIPWDALNNQED